VQLTEDGAAVEGDGGRLKGRKRKPAWGRRGGVSNSTGACWVRVTCRQGGEGCSQESGVEGSSPVWTSE
jgi:hypothetical protein